MTGTDQVISVDHFFENIKNLSFWRKTVFFDKFWNFWNLEREAVSLCIPICSDLFGILYFDVFYRNIRRIVRLESNYDF